MAKSFVQESGHVTTQSETSKEGAVYFVWFEYWVLENGEQAFKRNSQQITVFVAVFHVCYGEALLESRSNCKT